jgi:prophage antirepressor-like protein
MFGQIRTMTNDRGETFFVGKDVAEALGYSQTDKAILRHVDEDDRTKHTVIDSMGRNQQTFIINESGLYSLILSSKLEQAKMFKRWVTSEVLPLIRQTGTYSLHRKQIETLHHQIEALEPKAEYCDEVLDSVSCLTTTQIAKELSMTVYDLTRVLTELKVMYKQGEHWLLYADYARKGYAKSRTHVHRDIEGDLHTYTRLVWTEEGRQFIHRICRDEEIMVTLLFKGVDR